MSKQQSERPAGRKLAEWITLGTSIVIVLAVAGYLLVEAMREHPPVVPFAMRVLSDEARATESGFVVPLVVTNRGEQTVKELVIRVTTNAGSDKERFEEVTIDYLGEKASERVYLVFDHDPAVSKPLARALSYQLE